MRHLCQFWHKRHPIHAGVALCSISQYWGLWQGISYLWQCWKQPYNIIWIFSHSLNLLQLPKMWSLVGCWANHYKASDTLKKNELFWQLHLSPELQLWHGFKGWCKVSPCDSHLWAMWAMQPLWSTATIEICPQYKDPCHWLATLTTLWLP